MALFLNWDAEAYLASAEVSVTKIRDFDFHISVVPLIVMIIPVIDRRVSWSHTQVETLKVARDS